VARRDGDVVGGAVGRTGWAWLYVARLWVAEDLRGAGLGTRLMVEIEAPARERGCVGAWLDTFSFQARPFSSGSGTGSSASFVTSHRATPGISCRRRGERAPGYSRTHVASSSDRAGTSGGRVR